MNRVEISFLLSSIWHLIELKCAYRCQQRWSVDLQIAFCVAVQLYDSLVGPRSVQVYRTLIENYECHNWSHCKFSMNKLQTLPAHRTFSSDPKYASNQRRRCTFHTEKNWQRAVISGCRFVVSLSFFSDSFKCVLIYLWRSLVWVPERCSHREWCYETNEQSDTMHVIIIIIISTCALAGMCCRYYLSLQ